MSNKWKILFICLLLVISNSVYETSKVNYHIDQISNITSPYNTYGDPHKKVSLVGADETESVKENLIELSNDTGASFTLSYADPLDENNAEYYWCLQNEKYLNINTALNKNIDLETFNDLNEPITNYENDKYNIDLPLDTYNYKIYPFKLYDKSNLSKNLTVFAKSEQEINEFINGLKSKNIIYTVDDLSFNYQQSFLNTLVFTVFQNPLGPLALALLFISIFTFIYQDRRNLSIKLVNGYSKFQYILETNKNLLFLQIIIFIGSFLLYYVFSFNFNFSHFTSILSRYIPIILIINTIIVVYVAILVYSFTDINHSTYVQGIKSKALTGYVISINKTLIALLVSISLIPTLFNIIHSVSMYKSIRQETSKYEDVYILDSSGDYLPSIIAKSDEIIESLEGFENIIFIQPNYPGEGEETKYKVVSVNDNYIKRHPILDKNKKPIDPKKKNVVYTKEHNLEGVEALKEFPNFLCESNDNCLDIEVVIVDDAAELTFYSMDPLFNYDFISKDFVLVPRSENFFILQLFFVFENEDQITKVRNELKDIVDVESINFKKLMDTWTEELSLYRDLIIKDAIKLLNFLVIMIILSLVYYQVKFDKVRKEFSIYWVNGISKFRHFYFNYFLQIILNGIMIFLFKRLLYPELSIVLALILFLIYIGIDTLSLVIFRHQFYMQLQNNIKEQM